MRFLILFTFCITFLCIGFQQNQSEQQDYDHVTEKINRIYQSDLDVFSEQVNVFIHNLEQVNDLTSLQQEFITLRKSYKRVEPILIYHQEEAVIKYINGAPLPKVDPDAPSMEIIQPKGLQTIDELICAGDYEQAYHLSKKLSNALNGMIGFEKVTRLNHRQFFESMRLLINRMYTLTLTGFDTPACADPMQEAQVSLALIKEYFTIYKNHVPVEEQKIIQALVQHCTHAEEIIQAHNFDNLPRLTLFKDHLIPAYEKIYALHKSMKVEFIDEVFTRVQPYNYHAASLYDQSFLNKSYFAKVASIDLDDPKKIKLGKILFNDPVLSKDLAMSCSSCHKPEKAFTDGEMKSSTRYGQTTIRNAPSLVNAVFASKYFWDLREYSLERQVKHVIYDHNEFNMDFVELSDRLKESEEYVDLFTDAYGDRDKFIISTWSISNALAAYVASLTAMNSPFDRYVRGESDYLIPSAQRGHDLFMGKANCGTCHFAPTFAGVVPPTFSDTESEVLGVLIRHDTLHPVLDPDLGRAVNGTARDETEFYKHSFKTVTVRNIELTAPYFHNGAYDKLEDVVDFYNRGGGVGMGLDLEYQTLPPDPLGLTEAEKDDIIAFMNSLTDTSYLSKEMIELPKFSSHPEWDGR